MKKNRVFITHSGVATALGVDAESSVDLMINGLTTPYFPEPDSKYTRPFYKVPYNYDEYSGAVRQEAIAFKLVDDISSFFKDNKGVSLFLATSTGGIDESEKVYVDLLAGKIKYPLMKKHFFSGLPESLMKRYPGYFSDYMTFSTACSSSGQAILQAFRLIKEGVIDKAVVLGIDTIALTTVTGFDSLQLVCSGKSRPLTNGRDGLTLGEGAGIVVLQNKQIKGDEIEVVGAASTTDGYHISSPDPEGNGQKGCIYKALQEGGIEPSQVDYVNAHGTGTVMNDQVEIKTLKMIFGDNITVTSLKSYIGHTLGASTVDEIVLCEEMLKRGIICQPKDFSERMDDIVPEKTIEKRVKYFLKNSFGFGGNNVSLLLKTPN